MKKLFTLLLATAGWTLLTGLFAIEHPPAPIPLPRPSLFQSAPVPRHFREKSQKSPSFFSEFDREWRTERALRTSA